MDLAQVQIIPASGSLDYDDDDSTSTQQCLRYVQSHLTLHPKMLSRPCCSRPGQDQDHKFQDQHQDRKHINVNIAKAKREHLIRKHLRTKIKTSKSGLEPNWSSVSQSSLLFSIQHECRLSPQAALNIVWSIIDYKIVDHPYC